MENMWFNSWESILRILCVAPSAYIVMVVLLRVSGKRTLSKMNAFDFVVTIALGSVIASVAINQKIPLADGIAVMLVFIALQFVFTWLSVRFKSVKTLITSSPSLIFYKGSFLERAMKQERISIEEIYSAARQQGYSSLVGIDMIVLETTGDVAFIKEITNHEKTTIEDVVIEPL